MSALGDIYDALQQTKIGDALTLHSLLVEAVSEAYNLERRIARLEAAKAVEPEASDDGRSDYDFEAYKNGDQEERLRIILEAWKASKHEKQKSFFEGMMFADSLGMEQHPEWFEMGCACDLCLSYGDG